RRVITTKLERQQETIRQIAQEYGTQALSGRQEMMLQRVAALQDELTKYQMRKIALQVQVQLLESQKEYPLPPEDVLKLRHTFINSDMMVQTMITNIVELEQALIVAKQILAPMNPEIRRKTELVEALRQRLEQRRKEVDEEFSKMIAESMAKSDEKHLANTKIELEQIVAYENQLKSILDQEDADTIEVGRKQLAIQDLQNQLNLTRELYETINRRIQELEMERKRPARVSVAYYASSSLSPNKRKKYAIAVIFAAAAIGVMLALLKDKTDMSLRTPKDVAKRVGIQIIGTTTRSDTARKALPPGHLADDYQTICANLGLLTSQGIPKRIVISSPCPKDGKTTFAINLAISIAKTGKAVLLIDGDLRKPDIARLLSLTYPRNGIAELLRGKSLEQVRISLLSAGIDVVTANPANSSGIYRLITQKQTPDIIKAVSQKYDHIIIDSPPVLAVPDALLWARMADGVVLTSFAGHTESSDLKEAIQKLEQINISLIGTVLNNVDVNYNYNPYYGYEYTQNGTRDRKISRKKKTNAVLLPMQE
ncbi:MAG: polysaccharide biosynthesis tyrosine autokinase, partial [Planctomycetota bacterium]